LIRWACLKTACGIKHFGEQMDIPHCIQEDPRTAQDPVDRSIDILLFFQWGIPGVMSMGLSQPGFIGNGFDRLDCYIALLAGGNEGETSPTVTGSPAFSMKNIDWLL
jgi:hypothetical protein